MVHSIDLLEYNSCTVYTKMEQQLQDEYFCERCKQVALLEAYIRDLQEKITTLSSTDNLKKSILLAHRPTQCMYIQYTCFSAGRSYTWIRLQLQP